MIKRTIILSDDINKSNKAILTLECQNDKVLGEIRLFGGEIGANLALGIKNGDKPVIKIPLVLEENLARFEVLENIDCSAKIFAALVDIDNIVNPKVVISGSSYGGDKINDTVEIAFLNNKIDKDEMYELEEDIEEVVEENLKEDETFEDCNKCVNCKYRKCFYEEGVGNVEANTKEVEEKNESSFYDDIKSQIEELFKKHSTDLILEGLVPNSKWVRVNYEDSSNYYVLGLIYENGEINYIAYGLPANDNSTPPEDLKEYAQWLPLDVGDSTGKGYWVVYQSAKSGESVLINVV